ncbi:hypothetical protein L7F22_034565 [Adiantum nelumboides]|nr:hypothetical protein [Adiantum nelumboides]
MAACMQAKKQDQQVGGGHFSETSSNIQLKAGGAELSALCQTCAGSWVPAALSLHTYLRNNNGKVQVALPDERPGEYEKSCRNLKLNGAELSGEAQCQDGRYVALVFNLDDFVVNDDGKLCVRGGFFSRTSNNITFGNDGILRAYCQKENGTWVQSQIDLTYLIANMDGTLCYASPPPAGDFMETSTDVKLLGSKLAGRAERDDETYKPFSIQLDYNISNTDGQLVWSTNPK